MTTADTTSKDLSPRDMTTGRAPFRQRARLWVKRHSVSLYALALTVILGLLAIAPSIFIEVQAGHVGVLWLRFFGGTVTDRVLNEGTHMVFPWDKVTMYDVRLRTESRSYEAVSANGMAMTVEVALRYRINPPAAGLVHKLAGDDYAAKLVYPEIASLVYEFVSQHNPESFYSVDRADIQGFLLRRAQEQFPAPPDNFPSAAAATPKQIEATMIRVEDVLVAGVTFPPLVRQAIDRKVEQQQIMQEYDFRIAREAKERERKRIEAEGIRDFQDIVARNITPEYLRLRGIEATRAFATSNNAKTIIIGGRDGLPVILNTGDDAKPAPATASTPASPVDAPPGSPQDTPPDSSALPSDPAAEAPLR
ncbi:prohibitin family protein [Azospirillum rugosum]|uniref:Regulator of protease activity HflC (Stomatin/prohibitin superfamily) n=1 Tax=Azospirillum rugosum TaxID=416170 RepID=A0ABS4SGH6_9PROT|nr:prohibitin family protein [Azospirillum rugosum]MBP2291304.1 regulator of protease activity HflC (stomatin/prohibitin superfamily) [Azospirillum rugosum]MDQ0525092.1 regulator of protease activity HflC (stomatin/prohibitin superfamily) [Azospirillum rugosum]